MCKITYTEIQQRYRKCLQKLESHNSMASNNITHALPKDRQTMQKWSHKHGLRHSCQPQKITCVTLLKQQRQKKKFLQVCNSGALTPLQTDQN